MALHPCPHCGHPISEKAEKCPACGQNPHLTPEELVHRQKAEQARKKAQQKRALRVMIPCVAVAALIVAALFLLPDYKRYQNAKKQMDAGKYLDAIENFDALGNYLSAPDLSLQCKARVINTCAAPDLATASQFAVSLVSGGYKSASGVIPGTTVWYQGNGIAAAQSQQQESEFCMVEGCMQERLTGSFACMTHACRAPDCKIAATSGSRYCVEHKGYECKQYGCNERSLSFGGYCEFHQRNADERLAALNSAKVSAGETTTATQQETAFPDNEPDALGEPEGTNGASGQERTVRIYNKETGQWEWVAPDLSGGSTDTTTENPHKDQIYCRHYDPETGTWVWGWVDE